MAWPGRAGKAATSQNPPRQSCQGEKTAAKEAALAYVEAEPRAQQPEAHCDVQKS